MRKRGFFDNIKERWDELKERTRLGFRDAFGKVKAALKSYFD